MKRIAILGSTGSIGTQALDIIEKNPDEYSVSVLSCCRNTGILERQIKQFSPQIAVTGSEQDALSLQKKFPSTEIMHGRSGLTEAASCSCDIVLNALVGISGLEPTFRAIEAGNDIALANKETLVAGGSLIMEAARRKGVRMIPVDSEHSAIFQCLQGKGRQKIKKILLTGSGGPFRGMKKEELTDVTPQQALKHPRWKMGKKISIDSATLMNKGLEVIEARWLFGVELGQIEVLIHPQSIVHSMVRFEDNAVLAQMGVPDMRVPIAYALSFPDRRKNDIPGPDFFREASALTFEKPDTDTFRCLEMAFRASEAGATYPAVLNGANEVLVQRFLEGKIRFTDIPEILEKVLREHSPQKDPSLEDILEADKETREKI